eukprot:gnl/MRDRNA2_/MRDRNA2_68572_c0_seq1.p1 gnl/MRDRNA2_/MRDRNA2_68572_c0~~gnl/MRDRNA2_/MRDRNA2_68572_c0_seq1.p1  ORF type:complete len:304 (+),score=56.86 gnl/MRDRNA2_/MRDRNA2_68572_c0_seq1:96-914(+)
MESSDSVLNGTEKYEAIAEAFQGIELSETSRKPSPSFHRVNKFADCGEDQWIYGEITDAGCEALLEIFLATPKQNAEVSNVFLDVGSGSGRQVLFAAASGFESIGIELVPERHAIAERAHARMKPMAVRNRAKLICGDCLAMTAPFEKSTYILCNNAAFPDALSEALVLHISAHSANLSSFATLKKLPAAAVEKAGLVLVRACAIAVTWDASGWPLFVYHPKAADQEQTFQVDPSFNAMIEKQRAAACALDTDEARQRGLLRVAMMVNEVRE